MILSLRSCSILLGYDLATQMRSCGISCHAGPESRQSLIGTVTQRTTREGSARHVFGVLSTCQISRVVQMRSACNIDGMARHQGHSLSMSCETPLWVVKDCATSIQALRILECVHVPSIFNTILNLG